jgi:hypothetical protein
LFAKVECMKAVEDNHWQDVIEALGNVEVGAALVA